MMKALETWFHPDGSLELIEVAWTVGPGEDIWALCFRVLGALATGQAVFEELDGRVSVARRRGASCDSELWPLEASRAGVDALRDRVDEAHRRGEAWFPIEIALRCSPDLLLPSNVARVVVANWACDEDRDAAVDLVLRPAPHRDAPAGWRCWKVAVEHAAELEDAPVYLVLLCDNEETQARLSLGVHSMFELWQPRSFDGGGTPVARRNLGWLLHGLEKVACSTGGTVSLAREVREELARLS